MPPLCFAVSFFLSVIFFAPGSLLATHRAFRMEQRTPTHTHTYMYRVHMYEVHSTYPHPLITPTRTHIYTHTHTLFQRFLFFLLYKKTLSLLSRLHTPHTHARTHAHTTHHNTHPQYINKNQEIHTLDEPHTHTHTYAHTYPNAVHNFNRPLLLPHTTKQQHRITPLKSQKQTTKPCQVLRKRCSCSPWPS